MPDNPTNGLGQGVRKGHEEILSGVVERRSAGLQGPGTFSRHMISTTAVTVDSPDAASARSYFTYYTETATSPTLRTAGQYDDTFRRTADGWKLARRIITMG